MVDGRDLLCVGSTLPFQGQPADGIHVTLAYRLRKKIHVLITHSDVFCTDDAITTKKNMQAYNV